MTPISLSNNSQNFRIGTQRDSHRDYPSPVANRIGTGLPYVIGSPGPDADADEALQTNARPSPDATFFFYSDSCWDEIYNHDREYLTSPRTTPTPCPWCKGRLHHHPLCREQTASWTPTLPFGRHKGKRLTEVPKNYLQWLAQKPGLSVELREAIESHLQTAGIVAPTPTPTDSESEYP